MALVRIVGAILRNQRSVLTVSTVLNGEHGLEDVCLSVPSIVSQEGVERILEANLSPEEQKALVWSADLLRQAIEEII
jgi:L-lactate dehydrogenase